MTDRYESPEGRRLLGLVDRGPAPTSRIESYPVSGLNDTSRKAIAKAVAPVEAMIVHRPSWSALRMGESSVRLSMRIEDIE